jgi:hypothetical protein
MRLVADAFGKRRREPRLADAGLAGDQHHPPVAALRSLPPAQKHFDFLVAPDQRRRPGAQRFEAALLAAFAQDQPYGVWLGETGQPLRPEILEIEQSADLTSGASEDHQAGRWSDRLQSRREVGSLAND